MLQTRRGVICRQCYGSSKGPAVTANFALSLRTRHLPNNLNDSSQKSQLSKMTDEFSCSCRSPFAAWFLILIKTLSTSLWLAKHTEGIPDTVDGCLAV